MRDYRIYYKMLNADAINNLAVDKNSNHGKMKIKIGNSVYGSRPVIPANEIVRQYTEKTSHWSELKQSVLKEGFRNPIFCIANNEGIFSVYGTTRLWVAKNYKMDIPCIVADYTGQFHGEELFNEEDINAKFKDKPRILTLEKGEMNISNCAHYHLEKFKKRENPSDIDWIKEKEKYRKIWSFPSYRVNSPGVSHLDSFLNIVKPDLKETILDLGCGTGKAAFKLYQKGYNVVMVDITDDCLDSVVETYLSNKFKFIECALWELNKINADHGYCIDVMEHMPEYKVDIVLRKIYDSIKQGCFFCISTIMDSIGALIGEPLHLTVKPFDWWKKKIEQFNWNVKIAKSGNINAVFYVKK